MQLIMCIILIVGRSSCGGGGWVDGWVDRWVLMYALEKANTNVFNA